MEVTVGMEMLWRWQKDGKIIEHAKLPSNDAESNEYKSLLSSYLADEIRTVDQNESWRGGGVESN